VFYGAFPDPIKLREANIAAMRNFNVLEALYQNSRPKPLGLSLAALAQSFNHKDT